MNRHAPLKTKNMVVRPTVSWYNDNINAAKQLRSKAERKWRRTKSGQIETKTFYGKWLPDMSNRIDKMFIYCDQVQQSIVGNTKSQLLAIVPIKMKGQGSAALDTHTTRRIPKIN
jgi:hypothetical protein